MVYVERTVSRVSRRTTGEQVDAAHAQLPRRRFLCSPPEAVKPVGNPDLVQPCRFQMPRHLCLRQSAADSPGPEVNVVAGILVQGNLFVVPNAGDHLPVLPRTSGPDAALLHVGHLEPRKNLALLLQALALDPSLPALELAGAPKHDEEERLRALARELGVEGRVRFLGPVAEEELPRLYARCAAAVIPSRLEGFGIGVLEAQRARAPLAIANVGALPEVAGAGVPTTTRQYEDMIHGFVHFAGVFDTGGQAVDDAASVILHALGR